METFTEQRNICEWLYFTNLNWCQTHTTHFLSRSMHFYIYMPLPYIAWTGVFSFPTSTETWQHTYFTKWLHGHPRVLATIWRPRNSSPISIMERGISISLTLYYCSCTCTVTAIPRSMGWAWNWLDWESSPTAQPLNPAWARRAARERRNCSFQQQQRHMTSELHTYITGSYILC